MYNINKKQKIILGVLASIVAIGLCYYVYAEDKNFLEINQQEELEVEEISEESKNLEAEGKQEGEFKNEIYSDNAIIVHVSGAVNKEGIIELKVGSRIADAIDKAGGFKEDAYTKETNLAYTLEDGMKIYIPTQKEQEEKESTEQKEYITKESGIAVELKNNTQEQGKKSEQKVNINTATQTELETLPGIGPSTAMKIINYREENGKFKNIETIKDVSGIGESKFNNIKNLITIK